METERQRGVILARESAVMVFSWWQAERKYSKIAEKEP